MVSSSPQDAAPKVSVVIPTYNRMAFLPSSIDSILAQRFTDWDLHIIDDGSTDDTAEVLKPYVAKHGRIFVHRHETNKGNAQALNTALANIRGKYLAKLDDDDVVHTDWLHQCVDYMETHGQAFAVGTWLGLYDTAAKTPNIESDPIRHPMPHFFRVESLRALGGWSVFLPTAEDLDLVMRAEARGWDYDWIKTPLYFYNRVADGRGLSHSPKMLMSDLILRQSHALYRRGLPAIDKQIDAKVTARHIMRHILRTGCLYPNVLQHLPIGFWQLAQKSYLGTDFDGIMANVNWGPYRFVIRLPDPTKWRKFLRQAWMQARFAQFALWQRVVFCLAMMMTYRHYDKLWARWDCKPPPQPLGDHLKIGLILMAGKHEASLRAAVSSIQAQTYKNWALVILTQRASASVRRLANHMAQQDARLTIVDNHRSFPPADMFNVMCFRMQAHYIGVHPLGAQAHPERLAQCVKALRANPDWLFVSHSVLHHGCAMSVPASPLYNARWVQWPHIIRPRSWTQTSPALEDIYLTEFLRLMVWSYGHVPMPLLNYGPTPIASLRRAPQATAQIVTHDLIRRLLRAGLPDMHRQQQPVQAILSAYYNRLRLFPASMGWSLSTQLGFDGPVLYRFWRLKNYLRKHKLGTRQFLRFWIWSARQLYVARLPYWRQLKVLWQLLCAHVKAPRAHASS